MKTLIVVLLFVGSSLAAQVCPKEAPFHTSPIVPLGGVPAEGSPLQLGAFGYSDCLVTSTTCTEVAYFIQPCDVVQWAFGDGTTATAVGSPFIQHTYTHFGSYKVTAHITNSLGASDSSGTFYVKRTPDTFVDMHPVPVSESDGVATVPLTRSGDLSQSTRVNWTLYPGCPEIVSGSGTLTFAPGETERDLTFPIIWDHRFGPGEFAALGLDVSPDGARTEGFGNSEAQYMNGLIYVTEADSKPEGMLRDVTVGKGSATARLPFDLSNQIAYGPVYPWAFFRTIDGSARDGVDYVGTNGDVPLVANTSRVFIEIPLKANAASSGNRTFEVEVYSYFLPLLRSRATVTITDQRIVADPAQVSVAAGAYAKLTLSLGGASTGSWVPLTLASSDPRVLAVPTTISIPPDRPVTVFIHGLGAGRATISITAGGGRTTLVDVQVVQVRRRAA